MIKLCSIEGCSEKHISRGLCSKHYLQQKKIGFTQKGLKDKTLEERFWEKVDKKDKDSCWLWTGCKDPKGYGAIRSGKMYKAHRISYTLFVGKIPDGKLVCHKCDNPSCVNPHHLFTGSDSDNMQDMVLKGRHGKGGVKKRLLTEEQAVYVFKQKGQKTASALTNEFNISKPTIYSIWYGRNYSEVTKGIV